MVVGSVTAGPKSFNKINRKVFEKMSNAIQSFEKIKTDFAKKMQINRPRDGAFIDNNLSGDPEV